MDRLASGLILMALGVLLMVWFFHLDRTAREQLFGRLTTGAL